jgi:hypothetical protein
MVKPESRFEVLASPVRVMRASRSTPVTAIRSSTCGGRMEEGEWGEGEGGEGEGEGEGEVGEGGSGTSTHILVA